MIQGDGLNPDILAEGGVDRADFVIAITDDDKTNLLISNLAKRAGAKRALALINAPELASLAADMRVDTVLDPRALTVSQVCCVCAAAASSASSHWKTASRKWPKA